MIFSKRLIYWYLQNKRDLPWRNTRNPYEIWLSEIILQQTRVAQGLPYFEAFISAFPTVFDLANASEEQVLKLWQGLGYYSRARNLHQTAQIIVSNYKGSFPTTYNELLKLKGIGPYTAAAIASFSFDEAVPVVDGNVIRLVSRILGISEPVDRTDVKRKILTFVELAIGHSDPADFNQAIMDAGATLCTPMRPACQGCPFQQSCYAFLHEASARIPNKTPKTALKKRFFNYFDVRLPFDKIPIHQRQNGDIWGMLYEFPLLESDSASPVSWQDAASFLKILFPDDSLPEFSWSLARLKKQKLSHQEIQAHIYKVQMDHTPEQIKHEFYLVDREKVSNFAFPKLLSDYIKNADF
jgi:A/G-specific adenine glycosylase